MLINIPAKNSKRRKKERRGKEFKQLIPIGIPPLTFWTSEGQGHFSIRRLEVFYREKCRYKLLFYTPRRTLKVLRNPKNKQIDTLIM